MASGVSRVDPVTSSPRRRSLIRAQVVRRVKITIIMNNGSRHLALILSRAFPIELFPSSLTRDDLWTREVESRVSLSGGSKSWDKM